MLPFKFLSEMLDQTIVKVFTTQVCITRRCFDFNDATVNGQ